MPKCSHGPGFLADFFLGSNLGFGAGLFVVASNSAASTMDVPSASMLLRSNLQVCLWNQSAAWAGNPSGVRGDPTGTGPACPERRTSHAVDPGLVSPIVSI